MLSPRKDQVVDAQQQLIQDAERPEQGNDETEDHQRTPVQTPGARASTNTMQTIVIKRGVAMGSRSGFSAYLDTFSHHVRNLASTPKTTAQLTVSAEGAIHSVVTSR